ADPTREPRKPRPHRHRDRRHSGRSGAPGEARAQVVDRLERWVVMQAPTGQRLASYGYSVPASPRTPPAGTEIHRCVPPATHGTHSSRTSAPRGEFLLVLLRPEAHVELAADVEHRPPDHRRLRDHQRDRLLLGEPGLVLLRQRAERAAGAIDERLPARLARPAFEHAALDPCTLVVVEFVNDAALVEPGTRLLHRVAILDAVDGDRLGHLH